MQPSSRRAPAAAGFCSLARLSCWIAATCLLLLLLPPAVQAVDFYWTGNGDAQSWIDSANWQDNLSPPSDQDSNIWFGPQSGHFGSAGQVFIDYPANDPAGYDVATSDLGSFFFDNTSHTLPPVLSIGISGSPGSTYQYVTLHGGITLLNTDTTVAFAGRSDSTSNQLKLAADLTIDVCAGATFRFAADVEVSGPFGVIKNGAGTLTLNGALGVQHPPDPTALDPGFGLILNAGTLNVNSGLPGPFIINGGTIDHTSSGTLEAFSQVYLNGNVAFKGTNDLLFQGSVILTGERIVDVAAGRFGLGVVDDQSSQYPSRQTSLTKTGPGTLVLSGADYSSTNTIAGGVFVQQGILQIGNPHDVGSGSNIITIGNATLRIDGPGFKDDLHSYSLTDAASTIEVVGSAELNGVGAGDSLIGPGDLTFRGINGGTLILDSPAGMTGGSVTIESGVLLARCDFALPFSSVVTIEAGGSLRLDGAGASGPRQLQIAGLIINGDEPVDGRIIVGSASPEFRKQANARGMEVYPALSARPWLIVPDERIIASPEAPPSSSAVVVSVTHNGSLLGGGAIDASSGRIVIDGTLAPDGTMHLHSGSSDLGALTLTANSTLLFTIKDTGNDLLALGGTNLTLGGGALVLDLADTSATGIDYSATYTIFSGVSALSGSGFGTVSGYDTADYAARFALSGDAYQLHFEPIPEPATWWAAALALAGTLVVARSRQRRMSR